MSGDDTDETSSGEDLVVVIDGEEIRVPGPSPELRAVFDKIDTLMAGLNGAEALAAVASMYFDADGEPQFRRLRIRAVPDSTDAHPPILSD